MFIRTERSKLSRRLTPMKNKSNFWSQSCLLQSILTFSGCNTLPKYPLKVLPEQPFQLTTFSPFSTVTHSVSATSLGKWEPAKNSKTHTTKCRQRGTRIIAVFTKDKIGDNGTKWGGEGKGMRKVYNIQIL